MASNLRPIRDPLVTAAGIGAMIACLDLIDPPRPAGMSEPRWRILTAIGRAGAAGIGLHALVGATGLKAGVVREHLRSLRWKGLLNFDRLVLTKGGRAMLEEYSLSKSALRVCSPCPIEAHAPAAETSLTLHSSAAADSISEVHTGGTNAAEVEDSHDDHAEERGHGRENGRTRRARTDQGGQEGRIDSEGRASRSIHGSDRPADSGRSANTATQAEDLTAKAGRTVQPDHFQAIREAAERLARRKVPAARLPMTAGARPNSGNSVLTGANWIAERHARIKGAIEFLRSKGILVQVVNRDAPVRQYFMTGNFHRFTAEQVIARAEKLGWNGSPA